MIRTGSADTVPVQKARPRIECSTLRMAKKFSEVGIWLYNEEDNRFYHQGKRRSFYDAEHAFEPMVSLAKITTIPSATTPSTIRAIPQLCSSGGDNDQHHRQRWSPAVYPCVPGQVRFRAVLFNPFLTEGEVNGDHHPHHAEGKRCSSQNVRPATGLPA